eukprot:CAMPEP_0116901126 /NCGR_PEP_ID=MMETSP0467-20121206/9138_1 /TAXON_ID=283647 /ORGANISM="Mesodinium pulex, Strain SPMC105" /LENGTH=330 /DNA_ID=CAMNT_0004574521 /DNA_START=57 /DNA_END=1049 /DNA_ORIENTATION=-
MSRDIAEVYHLVHKTLAPLIKSGNETAMRMRFLSAKVNTLAKEAAKKNEDGTALAVGVVPDPFSVLGGHEKISEIEESQMDRPINRTPPVYEYTSSRLHQKSAAVLKRQRKAWRDAREYDVLKRHLGSLGARRQELLDGADLFPLQFVVASIEPSKDLLHSTGLEQLSLVDPFPHDFDTPRHPDQLNMPIATYDRIQDPIALINDYVPSHVLAQGLVEQDGFLVEPQDLLRTTTVSSNATFDPPRTAVKRGFFDRKKAKGCTARQVVVDTNKPKGPDTGIPEPHKPNTANAKAITVYARDFKGRFRELFEHCNKLKSEGFVVDIVPDYPK